jgi:hypothetical protein
MRGLLLVISISAAAQLPAHDVSHAARYSPAVQLASSAPRACEHPSAVLPPSVSLGPTVFALAGTIA